jgi:hypothetical protein
MIPCELHLSVQLCPSRNFIIGRTSFLKDVATDFAQKDRAVCEL